MVGDKRAQGDDRRRAYSGMEFGGLAGFDRAGRLLQLLLDPESSKVTPARGWFF